MGLRVNTNISSITAQRNLSGITTKLDGSYRRLSSGLRIAIAADDAAGLGISERMRTQIRSHNAAMRNAQDGIALVQTAEGALSEVNNILARMRELAVQAANGTLTSTDRATIQTEITQLTNEVDRIATTSAFNGVTLFDGSTTSLDIQVGINAGEIIAAVLPDVQSTTLGIGSIDVSTANAAVSSLTNIDAGRGVDHDRARCAGRPAEPHAERRGLHRERAGKPFRRREPHPRCGHRGGDR